MIFLRDLRAGHDSGHAGIPGGRAAFNPAIYFSKWYPDYHRRKYGTVDEAR